ncbi:MAG: hypothetical protein RLZZ281_1146 [Pseudomonadota bacterium]
MRNRAACDSSHHGVGLAMASRLAHHELLLALTVGFVMCRHRARFTVAESCTGGLVNHWLTTIPGSSHWFDGGVVSYSNAMKTSILGVRPATLHLHGAVSAPTAAEMAEGMRRAHRKALAEPGAHVPEALFSAAITGVAGPSGGSPEKPVGLVYFAWAGPAGVQTTCKKFAGTRSSVQAQSAEFVLTELVSRVIRSWA